jgi:hypothetical protein
LVWFWSLTKRHLSNKCCFHQNKIGLIAHALGGLDTVRRLRASGVTHECRTPGAATWEPAAGRMERLGERLAGFVVRRGRGGAASKRLWTNDCLSVSYGLLNIWISRQ